VSEPKVSIGVAVYNRPELVIRTLDSIMNQDYTGQIEIIITDDGSTDNTPEVLKAYEKFHTCFENRVIKYFWQTHGGIAKAHNNFLRQRTGDICGVLDSDDMYRAAFVTECVKALMWNSGIGLVYTDNVYVDGDGTVLRDCPAIEWDMTRFLNTRNIRGDCWLAWWKGVLEFAHYDETFKFDLDYDLYYQMAQRTNFMRVPLPLHAVREHGGRSTRYREEAAYYHAAALAKYGFSVTYAYKRAREFGMFNEWRDAIVSGYKFGKLRRAELHL